jgi:ABC-2 type transport system ATP-binding protein
MESCIETTSLTKAFNGFRAVDSIDLKIERGCFFGFLGPNGAGKSTTIKILTGLMAPSSGSARILGFDLAKEPLEIKRRIGVVPEDLCLFENLTAREYLTFIARMRLMPKDVYLKRIDELLNLFDLSDKEKVLVLEYSHGMKKKLSLAAALIHDPELLFLDEPFEGIDAVASRTIRSVLSTLVRRESTIFLTSHILDIVEKLCSHVAIINKGQLVLQSPMGSFSDGKGLEQAFIDAVGESAEAKAGLSWLDGTEQ